MQDHIHGSFENIEFLGVSSVCLQWQFDIEINQFIFQMSELDRNTMNMTQGVIIQNAVSDEWKNHCTDEALRDCIPRMLLNSVYNCGVIPFLERKFTFRK